MEQLIEVDRSVADAFFEAGGTIHIHPEGYGMHAGHTMTRTKFKSITHGLQVWRDEQEGKPLLLIDPDDEHPSNPLRDLNNPITEPSIGHDRRSTR